MGDRIVSGVCSLAQVPLALSFLGREAFGLWMTLTSLVTVMNIADFGLGIGLQNTVANAFGRDDMKEARRASATGILTLTAIGVVLFMLILPLCFLFDWGAIFRVSDWGAAQQTGSALAILLAGFCIGLPLTGAQRLASAFQWSWMLNLKNSLASVATLVLIAAAVMLKLSFLSFLAVVIVPQVVANFVLLIVLYRKLGWSARLPREFSAPLARALFQNNWFFILPQIGGTILGLAPPLLISSMLGAAALTPYNLVQRLLGLFAQTHGMLLAPIWPAYTEAVARGDASWVRATYRKSILGTVLFVVIPILSFMAWGREALHFWSRAPAASFHWILIMSLSVWTAVLTFMQTVALLMNALGRVKGQASYGLISVLISLALMPSFISKWGVAGAPLSLLAVFTVINLPLSLWEAHYHLRHLDCPCGTPTPQSEPK